MRKNHAIILIGGSGSRFSKEKPKQFFKLKGKEIVYYSIYNFLQNKNIDKIIITVDIKNKEFLFKNILEKYFQKELLEQKIITCIGGEKRIYSTKNAIFFIKNTLNDCKNVLIHDGCRPLFSQNLINNLIDEINNKNFDCIIPVLKIAESVKYIDNKKIESQNRDFLYTAQTPQICKFEALLECLEKSDIDEDHFANDESGFLERRGYKISFIEGEKQNIKITFQEDLKFAEFISQNAIENDPLL
jgi:2-C-methyl-D-erythritol 4-phosphate cytidylyltransferase